LLSKAIPAAGAWGCSATGPPTFPGADSSVHVLLFTPASTGPAVKENQPYGERQMTSSLTLPGSSSAGSVEEPLGNIEARAFPSAECAVFLTSRLNDRLGAPRALRPAPELPGPGRQSLSPAD